LIEPVRRRNRTGLGIAITVLVVVCAFWALRITQSQRFQTYIREVRLKQTLRAIKPPPGGKVLLTETDPGPYGFVSGSAVFSCDREFDKVKSHYLKEFARRGFVYQGDTVKDSRVQANFCATDYRATLKPMLEASPSERIYFIHIFWTNAPC
jgi:hypothetical protein